MRRREFLQTAAALPLVAAQSQKRKKIAALSTTYHVRSHSDNFITRFLEGYWINEEYHPPPCDIVSLYVEQIHPADVGRKLSMAYGFKIYPTIAEALTLGSGRLAVDGVLLIGEHGDYPTNEKGQKLYPRHEFFQQVVKVFQDSGRSAPVFVDKHLSYDWNRAKWMYDQSRQLKFPLMAGSSVSVTFRRPELDFPLGTEFEDAVELGGGWIEDGGLFHNLETLECFVERRRGGETGIRAVHRIEGDAVWKAAGQGRWSRELMRAALARGSRVPPGRPEELVKHPVACFLEYNDGFRGTVLMLGGLVSEHLVAFRVKGQREVVSTNCYIPTENSNNFSPLVDAIGRMYLTGKTSYPVERTLLTTGALAMLMESRYQGQKRLETPMLRISYKAPKVSYFAHGMGS
ncbi:MAG: hypothetical protein AAB225_14415 [Acidobacteriota bacterium]